MWSNPHKRGNSWWTLVWWELPFISWADVSPYGSPPSSRSADDGNLPSSSNLFEWAPNSTIIRCQTQQKVSCCWSAVEWTVGPHPGPGGGPASLMKKREIPPSIAGLPSLVRMLHQRHQWPPQPLHLTTFLAYHEWRAHMWPDGYLRGTTLSSPGFFLFIY